MTTSTRRTPGSRLRRPIVFLVVAAAAVAVIGATTSGSSIFGTQERRVETGVVVAVEATGLTAVQGFSIRTATGRTVDFRIGKLEDVTSFPPGHLAEHRVSLAAIRVTYVDEGGSHIAVRIEDAP